MDIAIEPQSVPLAVDEDGTIRVAGTRLTLDTVVSLFNQGNSPEVIASKFPTLSLADVYATIAYCLRNQAIVDAYMSRRCAESEKIEQKLRPFGLPVDLRARLLARREFGENGT